MEQEFPHGKGRKGLPRGGLESLALEEFQGIPGCGRIQVGIEHSLEYVTLESFSSLRNFGILSPNVWNAWGSSEGQTLHRVGMELHSMEKLGLMGMSCIPWNSWDCWE